MSLLGKVAALFGGCSARSVCVVDGDRLAGGDRVGPGERFQALSRLARFSSRESLPVTVVFGGRPLREAADESDYNGVTVRYGETPDDVRAKLASSLAKAGRSRAALVTSDAEFEAQMTAKGYGSMRVSTLRKAMEPAGSENGGREGGFNRDRGDRGERGERGDRGDRDGGRGRGRNRNRGRRPQGEQPGSGQPAEQSGGSRPAEGGAPAPAQASSGNDSVKSLIDLVE